MLLNERSKERPTLRGPREDLQGDSRAPRSHLHWPRPAAATGQSPLSSQDDSLTCMHHLGPALHSELGQRASALVLSSRQGRPTLRPTWPDPRKASRARARH